MKIIVLFILMFFVGTAYAQYSIESLYGKWKETSRTDKKEKSLSYKDTMIMEMRTGGFTMLRYHEGPTLLEEVTLSNGQGFVVKDKRFKIVSLSYDKLTLEENGVMHYMVRAENFGPAPVQKIIPGVERGDVVMNEQNLMGKWSCYKKEDPAFDRTTFYIKSIDIKEKKSDKQYAGSVSMHNMDSLYSKEIIMKIEQEDKVTLQADDWSMQMSVLKNNGEEWILRHQTCHYFLKRFANKR